MQRFLGDEMEVKKWGISVRGITAPFALIRRYPDAKGVLVKGVRAGKPAESAKPGLRGGDVLRSIQGREVTDLATFREILEKNRKKKKLVVELRRGNQNLVTVVRFKAKDRVKGGGELAKAWLGVRTQVMTPDVAEALRLKGKKGFRVTEVYPGTEAARAGLRVGDVIVALNGSYLRASRLQDSEILRRRIENMDIGDEAELKIIREGKETVISVKLEETPATAIEAKTAADENLEFAVREVTFADRLRRRWDPEVRGLIVAQVTSGGWASLGGLRGGDLILTIGGKSVDSIKGFKALMKSIRAEKPKTVKIFVKRAYRTSFVFIEPDWSGEVRKKK
jgi:serine protease Do